MREVYGSHPADLLAAIGPCIGRCCYTVGDEVRSDFAAHFTYGPELFHREQPAQAHDAGGAVPGVLLDLVEANRRQLLAAGVPAASISAMGECTACSRTVDGHRRYFSYRAEVGVTGRMMSVIGIAPEA